MKQRLTISAFCVAIVLFSITFSTHPIFRPIYALIVAVAICLALWEYYHIAHGRGFNPLTRLGIVASLAYVYSSFLSIHYPVATPLPYIIVWITVMATFGFHFVWGKDPFSNIAITIFGLMYLTIPLTLALNITYFFSGDEVQDGRWWLFYLLLITKITDTGAFFIGKSWGKKKLVPVISPKKTWEGAFGGLITAVITSLLFCIVLNLYYDQSPVSMSFFDSIWIAACISIIAQFGDLAESLLKRDVGVKDSSHLPGLGGMLDVSDSVVFTCPFLYFLLKLYY